MASASAGIAEDLFLLHRSGQVVQPFGIGELRQNFRRWRQEFRFGYPFQHNFVKGGVPSIQTASRWYGLYSNGRATRSVYQPASILGNSYLPSRSLYTVVRIAFL